MKTNDLWTRKMKEKLESFSSSTPQNGWEAIEDDLTPKRSGVHTRLKRTVGITLALLLAISAVAAALIYNPTRDVANEDATITEKSLEKSGTDAAIANDSLIIENNIIGNNVD
jgi:hypothetical protein